MRWAIASIDEMRWMRAVPSILSLVPPLIQSKHATSICWFAGTTLITSILCKLLITRLFFDYPIVINMIQMAATLFTVEMLRVCNVVKLQPYTFEKGRHVFVPSLLLSISNWLTVSSFEGIGLPLFDPVKRLTPLLVVAVGVLVYRRHRVDTPSLALLVLISLSTSLAVNIELTMDRFSFFYGLIAAVLHATAFIQFENLSGTLSPLEMLYMHSFNSLVIFLLADIVQDEIRDAFMYVMMSSSLVFVVLFLFLLAVGIASQLATFHCIEANGAVTTTVVANIRAVFQLFLCYYASLYMFYDLYPGFLNWLAFLVAVVSVIFYAQRQSTNELGKPVNWGRV